MHFHFDFSAQETLWTLTFAALLVVLVVLLGRDRVRRFPWFTAAIVMMALRELASHLLLGRMSPMDASKLFLVLSDIASVITFLMVVEIARRVFTGAKRGAWIAATLVMLAIGGVVLAKWGPWPSFKTMFAGTTLANLRLMQLFAVKADLLCDLLIVQLGVLVVLFGRRFHAGWRSHPQQIAVGLSTASMSQLAVRIIWQEIALHTTVHSQAEYTRVMGLQSKLYSANNVVYLCALVWWIACLWFDEPGSASGEAKTELPAPPEGENASPQASVTEASGQAREEEQTATLPTTQS